MKRTRPLFLSVLPALFIFAFVFSSCSKESSSEEENEYYANGKKCMDTIFGVYYWWCDQTPTQVAWNNDFYSYFDAHIVSQDRWSWMETGDEWRDSQSGTVTNSFGAVFAQPTDQGDYDIYVRYVLLNSPMYKAGVRRGWRLDAIGGHQISDLITSEAGIKILYAEMEKSSNTYVFTDSDSQQHTLDLTAATISTVTYLDRRVFTPEDYPALTGNVGYFNYRTFVSTMEADITETLSEFKSAGVSDLILDLRYNGGGSTTALMKLVGGIVPSSLDGEVFSVITHNSKLTKLNTTDYYDVDAGTLSLKRVFVITGGGTASASEVLINGLRDGLGADNVITVGDVTYGKPNGMYAIPYPEGPEASYYSKADYVFLPICFYTCNRAGEQIPDDGFVPVKSMPDDLYHDWGVDEKLIAACLSYIAGGSFQDTKTSACGNDAVLRAEGYKFAVEEEAAGYGRLVRGY